MGRNTQFGSLMSRVEEFGNYLRSKLVSDDTAERWAICQACPELLPSNRCNQCGCFMKLKTKIKAAQCPIGKW